MQQNTSGKRAFKTRILIGGTTAIARNGTAVVCDSYAMYWCGRRYNKGYYIMEITPQEFMHLQSGISAKDVLIAKLQEELEQAKADRDMWKERAQAACAGEGAVCVDHHRSEGVVVLSVELLKAILAKIHNLHILAVIALVLQRALHRGASAEERCSIAELVPLPKLPSISLTANGDIDVEGDWNDIHDNGNVKL